MSAGRAHFRVLKKYIAHAKLYLVSTNDGHTRVIIGSANLSERAFSGNQSETLVKFDDDKKAWDHYNRMFDEIRNSASDKIDLPEDRIINTEVDVYQIPVIADRYSTLVIEAPSYEEVQDSANVQLARVKNILAGFESLLSPFVPAISKGLHWRLRRKQTISSLLSPPKRETVNISPLI